MEEDESFSIPEVYEAGYRQQMEKHGTNIRRQVFLDERLELRKIHEELATPLGDDASGLSRIKIGFEK
jgi:hypothetical protein